MFSLRNVFIGSVFSRFPRQGHLSLAVAPILLAVLAGGAFAGRPIMEDPVPDFVFHGDADNLPVNCRVTPEELVAHARRIPSVQVAMQEFARRGYIAFPGADTAVSVCDRPASVVTFAYQKPGAWIDSDHVAVPTILVTTVLNGGGAPVTTVTGGILVADGQARVAFSGDSLAMFRTTDHSFDVVRSGGGGGKGSMPESMFDQFRDQDSSFNRWVRCVGWGSIGCALYALRVVPGDFRMKIALIMEFPEIGLGILGWCVTASTVTCIAAL